MMMNRIAGFPNACPAKVGEELSPAGTSIKRSRSQNHSPATHGRVLALNLLN